MLPRAVSAKLPSIWFWQLVEASRIHVADDSKAALRRSRWIKIERSLAGKWACQMMGTPICHPGQEWWLRWGSFNGSYLTAGSNLLEAFDMVCAVGGIVLRARGQSKRCIFRWLYILHDCINWWLYLLVANGRSIHGEEYWAIKGIEMLWWVIFDQYTV